MQYSLWICQHSTDIIVKTTTLQGGSRMRIDISSNKQEVQQSHTLKTVGTDSAVVKTSPKPKTVNKNKIPNSDIKNAIDKQTTTEQKPIIEQSKEQNEKEVIQAIEKANNHFKMIDRRLEFSIHEATKHIMVKVIDAANDHVIREIPSEKILDMVASMWETAGLLVDEKR